MDRREMQMEFRRDDLSVELRDALNRSADHETLKGAIDHYYASGGTKDEAYEALQKIWLEFGYDEDDGSQADPRRNDLEAVMERVWYWGG